MNKKICSAPKTLRLSSSSAGLLLTNALLSLAALLSYPLLRSRIFGSHYIKKVNIHFDTLRLNFMEYDKVSESVQNSVSNYLLSNFFLIFYIGLGLILAVALFALLTPYARQSEAGLVRRFTGIASEWKILLTLILLFLLLFLATEFRFFGDAPFSLLIAGRILLPAGLLYFTLGLLIVTPLALCEYLLIVSLKSAAALGFRKGVLERSALLLPLLRFLKGLFRLSCRGLAKLRRFFRINIRKNAFRKMTLILGGLALFLLLSLILAYGAEFLHFEEFLLFFLLILALFASAGFFSYRHLAKIELLTLQSAAMAGGDLQVKLPEDFGIFSELAVHFNHIGEGFQKAVSEEMKSQRIKTELITNVSHDLKTPLTSVINYADLLRNESLSQETRREYLEIIRQKSLRLQTLIEDLFEVSKAGSGNLHMNFEDLELCSLFYQTYGEFRDRLAAKDLSVIIRLPEEKIYCRLDGQRTHRVFENLFSNIEKYSLPGTRVYIDGIREDGQFLFTLKNISLYEMNFSAEDIAERFTRGDKSRHTEGSGLGLAIAMNLMQLQKGKMQLFIDGDLFKVLLSFPALSFREPPSSC